MDETLNWNSTKPNLNLNTNSNSNLAVHLSSHLVDSNLNRTTSESHSLASNSSDDEFEEETNNLSLSTDSSFDNEDEDLFVICSEKLKNKITSPTLDKSKHEAPDLFIENDLFDSDLSKNSNFYFPNVYNILQCLTLKSANDNFDLERYEILGV